jgi:hypothetical protein
MSSIADLLVNLLNYVVEQSKDIDPNGFKLTGNKEFVKYKPGLQGLPGVDFDKKIEGDHIWMRVERLTEIPLRKFSLMRYRASFRSPQTQADLNRPSMISAWASKRPQAGPRLGVWL